MAKINLSRMDFASLITLRKQVENALSERRTTLEKQLAALGGSIASVGGKVARVARGSKLKGKKVAPKYRGAGGETWAGRGATPRWLTAAIKEGKKLEDFLMTRRRPRKRQPRVVEKRNEPWVRYGFPSTHPVHEQDVDKKLKWCEALESTGPENVRLILGSDFRHSNQRLGSPLDCACRAKFAELVRSTTRPLRS